MTSLNKTNRQQIVNSVIAGTFIPEKREAILKATAAKVRAVVLSHVPADFLAATKNMPAEWFRMVSQQGIPTDVSPASVLDAEDRNGGSDYPDFEPVRVPQSWNLETPQSEKQSRRQAYVAFWEKHLATELAEAKKLHAQETKARDELMAFLLSVKTYAKVIEKMPDLAPHLPGVPPKVYPIVTSTKPLQSCLKNLGFDRSQVAP